MYSDFLAPFADTTGERSIDHRIRSFISGYTKCIYLTLGLSGIGLFAQFYQQATQNDLFVVTTSALAVLFLGQMMLSFYFIMKNFWVALLGAFCSLALAIGFTAILFIYEGWWGWSIMAILAMPLAILTFICLAFYLLHRQHLCRRSQRHFLLRNLLIPFGFLLLLSVLAGVFTSERLHSYL